MRLKVEITELVLAQWDAVQRVVRTEYEFPENASRACVTLVHGDEERHAEMPLTALMGLLVVLGMTPSIEALNVALAALAPDDARLPADETGAHYDDRHGDGS